MKDFTFKHKDSGKELTFHAIDWPTAWIMLAEYEYVSVDIVKMCWEVVILPNGFTPFPSLPKEQTWSEASTSMKRKFAKIMRPLSNYIGAIETTEDVSHLLDETIQNKHTRTVIVHGFDNKFSMTGNIEHVANQLFYCTCSKYRQSAFTPITIDYKTNTISKLGMELRFLVVEYETVGENDNWKFGLLLSDDSKVYFPTILDCTNYVMGNLFVCDEIVQAFNRNGETAELMGDYWISDNELGYALERSIHHLHLAIYRLTTSQFTS